MKNNLLFQFQIGKVMSSHFLSIDIIEKILFLLKEGKNILNIITEINFYNKFYFIYAEQISSILNIRFSSLLSQRSFFDILYDPILFSRINLKYRELLIKISKDFICCNCKNIPYCDCIEKKISIKIISLRIEGYNIKDIISFFEEEYGFSTFKGDLLFYLENIIRLIDAIEKICIVSNYKKYSISFRNMKHDIIQN